MKLSEKSTVGFTLLVAVISLAFAIYAYRDAHLKVQMVAETQESRATDSGSPQLPRNSAALKSIGDLSKAFIEVAEKVSPSVVSVFTEKIVTERSSIPFDFNFPFEDFFNFPRNRAPQERGPQERQLVRGLGSGVVIRNDGYILTNNHVVDEADNITVRIFNNETMKAKVIGRDPKTDIAVIKVDSLNLTPIPLGDSSQLKVGELVLAIGSPLSPELAHSVTHGIISAIGRSNVGLADYEDFIQTDAAINPGNSGGPLVNMKSEVIGINTAIVSQSGGNEGIGFAVPSNMVSSVMNSLISQGKVVRGYLGVLVQNLNENLKKAMNLKSTEGALIGDVTKDGPADKAGLKRGDVVVEFNGHSIKNSVGFRNSVAQLKPGFATTIKAIRNGKEIDISITLGEMPSTPPKKINEKPESKESGQQQLSKFGFTAASLSDERRNEYDVATNVQGVVVVSVNPGSNAFEAGLLTGDVIESLNHQNIQNMTDFIKVSKGIGGHSALLLQVNRHGNRFFIAYNLTSS